MTRAGRVVVPGALTLLAALLLTVTTAPAFPYQKPSVSLPKAIKALSDDQYRDIRFRPERALWRNSTLPFEILERQTTRNEVTGGWRVVVRFRRLDGAKPVELRAHLTHGNEVVSETWSYILPSE